MTDLTEKEASALMHIAGLLYNSGTPRSLAVIYGNLRKKGMVKTRAAHESTRGPWRRIVLWEATARGRREAARLKKATR